MKRLAFAFASGALVSACAACTPGAFGTSGGSSAAGTPAVTIDVNLTSDVGGATPAGPGAGYAPLVSILAVGDMIRFRNSDGFAHTASAIGGSTFPKAYPFTSAALEQSGATLSGGFSSGSLPANATSQALLADRSGTYMFGCFYHYGAPMRAVIEVR